MELMAVYCALMCGTRAAQQPVVQVATRIDEESTRLVLGEMTHHDKLRVCFVGYQIFAMYNW